MSTDKPIEQMSNSEVCWDEFKDWCEDNDVSLEHEDDWKPWWGCWAAAIEAKAAEAEGGE